MTTTEPTLPPGAAEPADWYSIDHEGLPTSIGRTVTTPDLKPFANGPAVRVECVQHSDGTYDQRTLVVKVDDEEFSGEDTRALARRLMDAAELFDRWATVTEPRAKRIVCTTWCSHGDGHPDMKMAEDQTCRSSFQVTDLDFEGLGGETTVYARRFNGRVEHVCLNALIEGADVDVPMTPRESRRVAGNLLDAAELIDGQPG